MNKVSVVIPAYNVEAYIADCIGSVISQSLKEIEIIVVEDHSTDKTYEIIQTYAAHDSRIKVVRPERNSSQFVARVLGVEAANSEYVMFVDGDDLLAPDACKLAYEAIESEQVDVLQYDVDILLDEFEGDGEIAETNMRNMLRSVGSKVVSISPAGLLDEKSIKGSINFTVWNKIYRRETLCLANAETPRMHLTMAEDVLYLYLILRYAHSFSSIEDRLYLYRFGCGISTTQTLSENQLNAIAKNAFVYRFLKNWTAEQGIEADCTESLRRVHQQLYNHIIGTMFHRLTGRDRRRFFAKVCEHGDLDDLVLGLTNFHIQKQVSSLQLATELAPLPQLRHTKEQVKTVGVYYFRVYNGGVENVISSLSELWVKKGYRVVLFTDEEPHPDDYYINPAVTRVVLPSFGMRTYAEQKARVEAFRAALIEHNVDLMVYNAWSNPNLVLDELIIKSCGVALTIHTHNLFCSDGISWDGYVAHNSAILGSLYRLADSIVTLTDVDTAWWQAYGLCTIKTVNPVWLPLDVEQAKLDGHRMLLVCRISPEKQVLDAIKIAELVQKQIPDAKLTIVGKGDYQVYIDQVHDYVKENKLESVVEFAGFQTEMLPYYQNADVLLSTARYEGFGLALMESKICGLPMVCYELPNLDIMHENLGMTILPQGELQAAADAVIEIFTNEEKRRQMGRDARISAERSCSVDIAERWEEIFRKTIEPKTAELPLYQRTPLEIAANLATEFYGQGIYERTERASRQGSAQDSETIDFCIAQCQDLLSKLESIGRSESYRLGLFLTAIPRRVKRLFRRKKK